MKNQSFKISINNGTVTAIYDDLHKDFIEMGQSNVRRVSSVEPSNHNQTFGVEWTATMADGTVLGPFPSRQSALDAEVAYLESQLFE